MIGGFWSVGRIDSFAGAGYDGLWIARYSFLEEVDNFSSIRSSPGR